MLTYYGLSFSVCKSLNIQRFPYLSPRKIYQTL